MSTHTNLDIQDAACLHIVYIWQHLTSHPITKSTQTTMVNAPKKNFSPLPVGRYSISTKWSTKRCHEVNASKSGLEAEIVQALGALRNLRFKKKLAAEKQREMVFLSNEEKEKWIEDYVEREIAGARKRGEDAEAAVQQQQEDMQHAKIMGLTTTEQEKPFGEMMVAIGESWSELASSDDGEDGEDAEDEDDEETDDGKLSEDDEPSWVLGLITKTVQQRMERFGRSR